MPASDRMHPFVALMRRYCIDYTNSHDQSLYPELFTDDYVVRINGVGLPQATAYAQAVADLFAEAPGLGLTVHELVLNGDRLCMRFSEHAAFPAPDGRRLAAWSGIGLYQWDGERLTGNHVEQDFASRRAQLASGVPQPLEPPHLDPWMTTVPVAPVPEAEAVARQALVDDRLLDAAAVRVDDGAGPLAVAPEEVVVNDIFSAGRRVAIHATCRGAYRGGVPGLDDDARGRPAELQVAALVLVADDGTLADVRAVTSRDVVRSALRRRR
ncbi:MAG TPA: nuclear transport factor 2 family protein [Iamia sp.]|nr:nuclear transport factor 2 family protein [Iamia sp.]